MPIRKRTKLPAYPDGIVRFVKVKTTPSSFNAPRNPTTYKDLELVHCCVFAYEALREQDVEVANQLGTSFNLKIRTPKAPNINSQLMAQIGNMLYNIVRLDPSTYELFVYLEGGSEIDVEQVDP